MMKNHKLRIEVYFIDGSVYCLVGETAKQIDLIKDLKSSLKRNWSPDGLTIIGFEEELIYIPNNKILKINFKKLLSTEDYPVINIKSHRADINPI